MKANFENGCGSHGSGRERGDVADVNSQQDGLCFDGFWSCQLWSLQSHPAGTRGVQGVQLVNSVEIILSYGYTHTHTHTLSLPHRHAMEEALNPPRALSHSILGFSHLILAPSAHFLPSAFRLKLPVRGKRVEFSCVQITDFLSLQTTNAYMHVTLFMCFNQVHICVHVAMRCVCVWVLLVYITQTLCPAGMSSEINLMCRYVIVYTCAPLCVWVCPCVSEPEAGWFSFVPFNQGLIYTWENRWMQLTTK